MASPSSGTKFASGVLKICSCSWVYSLIDFFLNQPLPASRDFKKKICGPLLTIIFLTKSNNFTYRFYFDHVNDDSIKDMFCVKHVYFSTEMVFCYRNCSDLLREKNILVIEKIVWYSRLKAENLQNVWDHYSNLFKQWKFSTMLFQLVPGGFSYLMN